ncbi:hypothetical protein Q4525_07585 [Shimia thalassica]|uniref:hypothetical protein n=1 Tax=Shimia thalassica TaxID=1715693 RepID=UPI001C0931A0|nr:hypothetical protein [Shimia thalassica]MBU2943928.1 hypothetical protein [Shimia thalassica]MDO6502784.1 hypothetical protein [Shimia thalassica]
MLNRLAFFGCSVAFWVSVAIAHDAPETPKEKGDYIENHLVLFEIEASRINTYRGKNIPAVRYAIKNAGQETLTEVKVIVYFLDENGKRFFEEDYYPVLVSEYNFDGKPLKPNYTYRMESNIWMTVETLGDEWSGEIEIEITDIEFAD